MHFEPRLWTFTEGVRLRILWAVALGLAAAGLGAARLALLGWLIGAVLAGRDIADLALPVALIAAVMLARSAFEHWRAMAAHETAARVQKRLRRAIFDQVAALGPGTVARHRSGAVALSLVEGVEQLEVYFGQFLPQFLIALLTPVLIVAAMAALDLPVALVMLGFALLALFGPALWHKRDAANALGRQQAYAAFAAEFLDSIQGLATLKAFGQSRARGDMLAAKALDLFRKTMWVLGTNVLARGITDCAIAGGAAAALALGALRVESGAMTLPALLVVLMLGVEVYRPMRELRAVLHQGMVGMSAAQGIYRILDERPAVAGAPAAALGGPLAPSIAFEGVRFRYPHARRLVHDGLSFAAAPGERIGVVGASGGGKSSIVRLLLRFYDPEAGRVAIGGHDVRSLSFDQIRSLVAVVNQDTYLFHGTVAENIAMGRPGAAPDEIRRAAQAAHIDAFVMGLPQGYDTIVGEKGIKLSGGQRQRVAIARALLRDAPILVLDEALSAVDAESEAAIQGALDALMRGRTTLVLAHRLSSVIGCDRILVLDGGMVAESGRHAELMAQGGLYARLMAEQVRDAQAAPPGLIGGLEGGAVRDAAAAPGALPAAADGIGAPGAPAPTEGIIKAEGLGWLQLIGALMAMAMPWKGRLALTFSLGVARVLAFIGVGVLSALVVVALRHGESFGGLLVALAVAAPISGLLHWLESWVAHDMAFRLLAQMRIDVFRTLDALAPAYLVRRRTGDLLALATHDVELVEYFFAHTVAPAFVAVLVPAAVLAALAAASPWIALALAPFLLAAGLSPFLRRGRVDQLGSAAREAAGTLAAHTVDSVQGLGELVAFQQERARGDALDALSDRHARLRLPFFGELTLQHSLLDLLTGWGGLAVVVAGAALAAQGAVDAAALPLLALLAMAAFLPVSEIAQVGRQLADTLGATRRLYGLFNEAVPVTDGPGVDEQEGVGRPGAAALALEGVGFAYPGQHRPALTDVSIAVPAGKTLALVGASGAGKSTTAQLLLRFWDPLQGRILLNGHDLRAYRLDALRARMALVAQDTYLFNDTLRRNILIARPDADEAALRQAVSLAALDELVAALPDGLETPVGERGASLSGGQRQRVAIARAFLKDAPVLVLDEATSHLDATNEATVRRALDRLRAARTTVVIAHRLSTVRDADVIVVLDRGRVAEAGTHPSLLAANGLYARLVGRQLAASGLHAAQ
ncbi:MAG: ABC transporter ATP-binding protein [Alphaproteobacteria bacterium]|nr:ABC transporter ATP-binding protein [Alphaproteobacteria bacterium]